jgi:hypothetical protein
LNRFKIIAIYLASSTLLVTLLGSLGVSIAHSGQTSTPATVLVKPGQVFIYRASWMGLPVGTARVSFSLEGNDNELWRGVALVRTNAAADAVYKMRDRLSEDFDAYSLEPRLMEITQHENRFRNRYTVTFSDSTGSIETLQQNRRGMQRRRFQLKNAFGPISAGLKMLSQPLEVGQHRSVLVFTGTSYYLVELSIIKRERLASALGDVDTLRSSARIVRSSQGSGAGSVHDVTVWISAAGGQWPLRVQAMTFVGPLRADLIYIGQHTSPRAGSGRQPTPHDGDLPPGTHDSEQDGSDAPFGTPMP